MAEQEFSFSNKTKIVKYQNIDENIFIDVYSK